MPNLLYNNFVMQFFKSKNIFVKIVLVILFLFVLYGVNKIYEVWRSNKFLKSLKGEIIYVSGPSLGEVYKIKANGEDNRLLYSNSHLTIDYIRWLEDGKIQFLASQQSNAAPTGNEYKLVVMDANGGNVQINLLPLQPLGDEQSGEKFQKYVNELFKIERQDGLTNGITVDDGLYIDNGSVIYLAQNGEPVKIYNHLFYDFKFNRGPDAAKWSPDKNFIAYNNVKGLTLTDRKGSVRVNLPMVKAAIFDWRY